MKNLVCALLLAVPFATPAADDISHVNKSIHIEAGQSVGDVDSVNGGIRVDDGATTQDIDTVNGAIAIGKRANVGKLETVNGSIDLGEESKAASIENVNGALSLGAGSEVLGGVEGVNGHISLTRAGVGGKLENVNGRIVLDAAHVAGGVETTNGDIDVGADSRIEGGIHVRKQNSSNWFGKKRRPPTIIIGPNARVSGELRFDQPVALYVSDRASIGNVTGATPIRFSGDRPDQTTEAVEK